MKTPTVLFALGLVGIVGALVFEGRRRDSELVNVQRQLRALSISAVASSSSVSAPSVTDEVLPVRREVLVETDAGGAVASASPEPRAAPSHYSAPVMRDAYEIAFLGQHVDSQWTGQSLREARNKLTTALPEGSALRSFECRETLCRVETSHADLARYHAFVKTAFRNQATRLWNAPGFSTLADDASDSTRAGALVTVSYIAREGHELPPTDQ
jgi:hypothetical protein